MTTLSYVPAEEIRRLRALPIAREEQAQLFATCCRINALYMIGRAGSGHIGTTFSSLDVVSWLHLNELGPSDLYFSSKGHDVPGYYAVAIALGQLDFELLHQLRRLDGLPGHPDIGTPTIVANTGSLGMGISKAKGMAIARRIQGKHGQVYVLTGDGELQEGQFWESLHSAANQGLHEITVIVDHNKVQSDTLVSRVSDLGNLEAKLSAFGWHVARCDGHDVAQLRETFAGLGGVADRPKIVIADTVKGKGVSFMEHTAMPAGEKLYRFHSGAPSDDVYARALEELVAAANDGLRAAGAGELCLETVPRPPRASAEGLQRMVPAYSKALVDHAAADPRIVALDADLVLDTGLIPFQERFPERFVECGIAEQDMVSQASGLALQGMLPVVHSFACFLSTRPNEQIYNNATERTKIVYVGSLAGLLPGGPGHSHQSVRDISALAANPGMVMIEPCSEREVALAVDYCLTRHDGSAYIRLVSIPCAVPFELPVSYELRLGEGVVLAEGDDAVIFAYGPVMLAQAFLAAEQLRRGEGVAVRVVNMPWLNVVDQAWLRETIGRRRWVFTVDDHYLVGGQGEMLAAHIAELGLSLRLRRFGVEGIPACGQNDEVLRAHGLDAESLAAEITACLVPTPA